MGTRDLFKTASVFGGLVAAVGTVIGGGWQLATMLRDGSEAYAQVRDLKDDVEDLEKRYNAHIEAAWKKYQLERSAKPGERVFPKPDKAPALADEGARIDANPFGLSQPR